ncbi:MAG TPA: hypothetical protein VL147_05240 [Devosia sp.]|uniref:hypothetical protein n=1 Tax=Pararhizobium sp. TaxID=1977563 RepID=UPI002C0C54A4|nr:hypothetical protein [Pararhizobium sp.]HTN60942.1 hypothetical protein [Devosia sp.]HTO32588.1 hypothetical protein [Pararhizobium sp.]
MTEEQREKARARWRRNKANERKRNARPGPPDVPVDLLDQVITERNRRAKGDGWWSWHWEHNENGMGIGFVADVWAAVTLLEWQLGKGKAKPAKIAKWLSDHGCEHRYSQTSLRIMIYRARNRIIQMESPPPWPSRRLPRWPSFDIGRWPRPEA